MASKKPWRTVIVPEETGRFTREQLEAAVTKVIEERKRKAAHTRKAGGSSSSREGTVTKPAKSPARQSRKAPKAA